MRLLFSASNGKTGPLPQYVLLVEYFPYNGLHFQTMELDKTMDIGFFHLIPQYFKKYFHISMEDIFP